MAGGLHPCLICPPPHPVTPSCHFAEFPLALVGTGLWHRHRSFYQWDGPPCWCNVPHGGSQYKIGLIVFTTEWAAATLGSALHRFAAQANLSTETLLPRLNTWLQHEVPFLHFFKGGSNHLPQTSYPGRGGLNYMYSRCLSLDDLISSYLTACPTPTPFIGYQYNSAWSSF